MIIIWQIKNRFFGKRHIPLDSFWNYKNNKADNNLVAGIVLKAMCILHFMFPGANTTENEPDTTYPVVSLLW